jgi:rod shape determining protein RodA
VIIILAPTALVVLQPDLGTALLLLFGGAIVMFAAGVSLWYFGAVLLAGGSALTAVFASRGTPWQILHDYQYSRIDVFLDPALDPLKAGYHITQAKIALGSGGWFGKGFMQGTQTMLDFLPEKHTDFIFTTLAEQFGFVGGISLLMLYGLIIVLGLFSAMRNKDRFGALVTIGIIGTFFLLFAVNMSMVMGLAPVVGVPLPMVSWGGTAMIILMCGFGLVQSAHVHRPRTRS